MSHRRNDLQFKIINAILLMAMILLFVVSILVLLIYLYIKCILKRRQARHRQIATIQQLGVGAMHLAQPPKLGLEPSVIASLPIFVYKQTDESSGGGGVECAVCLGNLEEEEIARVLPSCNHTFHATCIDLWLMSHSTCPICRTEADPRAHSNVVIAVEAAQPSDSSVIS
ncbi:zinc finger protein [Macleaya cordata]|uniref:RING-type E3 ubiquitin transferase n=1 Tax=Macleaya cordata TaxID=56857 RepID=A0A200Q1B1_MACCD|nr:zinc finger protein [Macleaya cordata]